MGEFYRNLLGFKKDEILKGLDNGLAKAVNGGNLDYYLNMKKQSTVND